jgi:glycosylphosphatidylinositol transamidase (GPIT) subunit GPI8
VIASFENLDRAAEVYSSTQNVIAFYHGYSVTVWNFVLDSMVTWDVSMEYQSVRQSRSECSGVADDASYR